MTVLEPGGAVAAVVPAGARVRIGQVEGGQVADLVSFARPSGERLSMFRTRAHNASWRPSTGAVLASTAGRALWTIVEDTVGENYVGGGYCNPRVNLRRYGTAGVNTCEQNLARVLAEYGLDRHGFDPDTCFNVFMNVGYDPDGTWAIRPTPAVAGDHILLRAETDQLVAVSNCPQVLSDVNARDLKSLEWEVLP